MNDYLKHFADECGCGPLEMEETALQQYDFTTGKYVTFYRGIDYVYPDDTLEEIQYYAEINQKYVDEREKEE